MTFIRPELRVLLWKWREAILGLAVAILGVWAVLATSGLLSVIGGLAAIVGVLLTWLGVQRVRFRRVRQGPGSVDVDEGQITYFGPLTGGTLALRDMQDLVLIRAGGQSPHWRLSTEEDAVFIPVDADGTDALFDAFATLPGLHMQRLLAVLNDGQSEDVVVWQRPALRAV